MIVRAPTEAEQAQFDAEIGEHLNKAFVEGGKPQGWFKGINWTGVWKEFEKRLKAAGWEIRELESESVEDRQAEMVEEQQARSQNERAAG